MINMCKTRVMVSGEGDERVSRVDPYCACDKRVKSSLNILHEILNGQSNVIYVSFKMLAVFLRIINCYSILSGVAVSDDDMEGAEVDQNVVAMDDSDDDDDDIAFDVPPQGGPGFVQPGWGRGGGGAGGFNPAGAGGFNPGGAGGLPGFDGFGGFPGMGRGQPGWGRNYLILHAFCCIISFLFSVK